MHFANIIFLQITNNYACMRLLVSVITWKMSFLPRPWTIFSSNWGYIIGFFWLCDWLVLISEPLVLVSTETNLHSCSSKLIHGVKRGIAKANMETSTVGHIQLHFKICIDCVNDTVQNWDSSIQILLWYKDKKPAKYVFCCVILGPGPTEDWPCLRLWL